MRDAKQKPDPNKLILNVSNRGIITLNFFFQRFKNISLQSTGNSK